MMSACYCFDATQQKVVNITSLAAIIGIMLPKRFAPYGFSSS
jgi:hypothetical protein